VLPGAEQSRTMLGDADHLTLDSFQHTFGQYDVVA
jgi:hypothetical protein